MLIIFLYLPAVICLFSAASIWNRRDLTLSERLYGWTMLLAGAYLTFGAIACSPYSESEAVAWANIGLGFVVPPLQLAVIFISWSLHTLRQRYDKPILLLNLLPAMTGFLMLFAYGLIGFDSAVEYLDHNSTIPAGLSAGDIRLYRLFRTITCDVYRIIVVICISVSVCYQIYVLLKSDFGPKVLVRFLFARGPMRPLQLFILLYIGILCCSIWRWKLGRDITGGNLTELCVLFSIKGVCIALMGVLSAYLKQPCVYLHRPHPTPYFEDMPVRVKELIAPTVSNDDFDDEEADSYRTLNLRDEFRVLMQERACYLQPGMSRYSVSRHLNISRTGLDRLVRLVYHLTYMEYVLVQRVSYKFRYTKLYPKESSTEVAMACGFPSVREMNRQVYMYRAFFVQKKNPNEPIE